MLPDFIVPIAVGWIIQFIKLIIDFIEERKFRLDNFWRAGGFPSVHSWISSSITTLMLLKYWLYSPPFTIAFIFSFLFWYDAMNVRFEAGKHATYLNKIWNELRNVLNFTEQFHSLKERLGHDFIEVVWWIIIWSIITLVLYFFLPIVNTIWWI